MSTYKTIFFLKYNSMDALKHGNVGFRLGLSPPTRDTFTVICFLGIF